MAEKPKSETEPTDASVAGAPSGAVTVPLRKPITAYGEERTSLSFREPTVADLMSCGNPVTLDWSQDPPLVRFDTKAMSAVMAALAVVPLSSIAQMHPRDWQNAAWLLSSFFTPDLGGGGTS